MTGSEAVVVIIGNDNKELQLAVLEVLKSKGKYNTQKMASIDYYIKHIQESMGNES